MIGTSMRLLKALERLQSDKVIGSVSYIRRYCALIEYKHESDNKYCIKNHKCVYDSESDSNSESIMAVKSCT